MVLGFRFSCCFFHLFISAWILFIVTLAFRSLTGFAIGFWPETTAPLEEAAGAPVTGVFFVVKRALSLFSGPCPPLSLRVLSACLRFSLRVLSFRNRVAILLRWKIYRKRLQ